MKKIKIGLPRALLYHKNGVMWRHFSKKLGCKVIISSETNEEIISTGIANTISTTCIPYRIYIGHILSLMDCDYIFIARICNNSHHKACSRFNDIYDNLKYLVTKKQIIDYSAYYQRLSLPFLIYMKIGLKLTWDPLRTLYSYFYSLNKQKKYHLNNINECKNKITNPNKKVLVLSHIYNLKDKYVSDQIIKNLKENNIIPIMADGIDKKTAILFSEYSPIPLETEELKELVGSLYYYYHMIDGVIFIKTNYCLEDKKISIILKDNERDIITTTITIDDIVKNIDLETKLKLFINDINTINIRK